MNSALAYVHYIKLFKCRTINSIIATHAFNTFGSKDTKTLLFWPKCKNLCETSVAHRKPQNPLQR